MSMTEGVLTALPAPEGYEVNFANPPQVGDVPGYFVTSIGLALAASFLGMRLYTRCFITRNFGLEDAAVTLSFAFGLATQGILLNLWAIKAAGVHAWEMPFDRYQFYTVTIMVASVLYVPCLGCAKISILLLYHRLSKLIWFKIAVYIVIGIVTSYSLGIIVALIFPCQPIAMNWDLSITEGKCIDKAGIYLATAAVNVITDFIILLLPIPVVMSLQMKRLQKFGVIGLFVLGSLTFVTSIVRLVYMVPMVSNMDQTRAVSIPCVWINVEANLVVITTSLPSLRSFLRHFLPSVFDESAYAPKKYAGYGDNSAAGVPSKLGTSRSRYGRMDSASKGTIDVEMSPVERDPPFFGGNANSEIRGNASDVGPDDGSEKAIWQTRTVTVEYGK